jgi:hypothetical protein
MIVLDSRGGGLKARQRRKVSPFLRGNVPDTDGMRWKLASRDEREYHDAVDKVNDSL